MLERLRRTPRKIQTLDFDYSDLPTFIVSPKTFKQISKGKRVYETNTDMIFLNDDGVIRSIKERVQPRIIKTKSLTLHPDYSMVQIEVSQKALFEWSVTERTPVVETDDFFMLPGQLTFIAKKRKS